MIELRPHQIIARERARELFRLGKRGLILVAPCGWGKTIAAADIIRLAQQRGTKTLFLAHREELINQASDKLSQVGLPHGIIMAGRNESLSENTQVASVQTIVRRLDKIPFRPDFIVIDECHLSGAPSYHKIVQHYGSPKLLGLSATPQRLDGKGLGIHVGGLFDGMVITSGTADLIREGYLSPFKYFAPSRPDVSQLDTVRGDYDLGQVSALVDRPTIVGDAVKTWLEKAKGRQTIVFAASIQHAKNVCAEYQAAGINARWVSGETSTEDRRDIMAQYMNRTVTVLVNCALYIEGIDAPLTSCIQKLAPTKSLTRCIQSDGRGLRTHPGKVDCIILDHAGMVFEHGLPDEMREWSLDGKPKSKLKPQPIENRQCPSCCAIHAPSPTCPQCGHEYEIKSRSIRAEEGNLVQLTAEDIEYRRVEFKREEKMAKTLNDFLVIERRRGYKHGWAFMRWKQRRPKMAAASIDPAFNFVS